LAFFIEHDVRTQHSIAPTSWRCSIKSGPGSPYWSHRPAPPYRRTDAHRQYFVFIRLVAGGPRLREWTMRACCPAAALLAVLSYLNAVKPLSLGW